jgi:hypothetical protein
MSFLKPTPMIPLSGSNLAGRYLSEKDPDPDRYQNRRVDPNRHQGVADPQNCLLRAK